MMTRLLTIPIALCLFGTPTAQVGLVAQAGSPTIPDSGELWTAPTDLAGRDFFYGPWGHELAPDPAAVYTFVAPKLDGNPGMTVRDPAGRQWKVKQAPLDGGAAEGPIEVVLSRVLSGVGYHQPPVYFVPSVLLSRDGGTERVNGGRFRLSLRGLTERDEWSWKQNPFVGTRPFNGLLVMLLMFNSSDLKSSNNSLYEYRPPGAERAERWFVVRDLGTSLGSTSPTSPVRGNIDAFERLGFIKGVANGFVVFDYHGPHRSLVERRITPEDVAWAARLLAGVSDRQWTDAFRAGGYTQAITDRFVSKLKSKIRDGLAVDSTERH